MICMTNEEHIYLSFVHSLLREVPGLSQYLQAYGTNEASLINALDAAFQNAHSLLCYILRRMLQWTPKSWETSLQSQRVCPLKNCINFKSEPIVWWSEMILKPWSITARHNSHYTSRSITLMTWGTNQPVMGCNSSTLAKIRIARTFQSLLTSRSKGGSTFCHVKSTGFSFLFKTWFFFIPNWRRVCSVWIFW